MDKPTRSIINHWKRCRDRKALPEVGGLMDQSETLMQAFDVIDAEITRFQAEQTAVAQQRMEADIALRRRERGH